MPAETQLLYFHFILRADDDGIVESYPVLKLLGIASDNYKLLIAKGYIRELNADQVIIITDWLEHNSIRADRKVNSIYLPLMQNKFPELPFIEPKPRSDVKDNSKRLCLPSTDSPRTEEVKLSKVKKSKVKLVADNPPTQNDIIKYINDNNYNVDGEYFYQYFTESNWIDSKGNSVYNWKQKIITWSKGNKNGTVKKDSWDDPKYN
ncbi:hypothetical protein A2Z67_06045 [Candidatus Woesebacteria bacterium RBG_13_36_22]|uniref:Replication protein n=1 Tax=Candidatus Woesebacteria bacterium RBG_13_36_22 TaxID=1802478 RepID=A0A1F7X2N5_9BACT|nr:MAG: hypothetical protein A2Z67_06045 [Candidatus Woesebacteria bacterium RBG_13_36_22]